MSVKTHAKRRTAVTGPAGRAAMIVGLRVARQARARTHSHARLRTSCRAESRALRDERPYAVTVGVLFDYFAAPGAAAAAETIDWVGGPSRPPNTTPPVRRGLFGRRPNASDAVPQAAYRTLNDTGIDPVVQAGTLENLLTGRSFDEILTANAGAQVAVRDGGQRLVLKVSDGLVDALSAATADSLADVAEPWSHTEEFWGAGDPEELAGFLTELAALARHARGEGQSVYCWTCV